jgi:hypothetical protein
MELCLLCGAFKTFEIVDDEKKDNGLLSPAPPPSLSS